MEPISIIIGTIAVAAIAGLAWVGGYELGQASGHASGASAEREMANRRVNGVLDSLNNRRPKSAKNKRKAARKAVRA